MEVQARETRLYRQALLKELKSISSSLAKIHKDLEHTREDMLTHLLITQALTTLSNTWDTMAMETARETDKPNPVDP